MGKYSRSVSRTRSRSRSRGRGGGGGGGNDRDSNYDAENEGYRVHIADLGISCSQKELEKNFSKYGEFKELW